jgi:hypothetical protein
MTGKPHPQKQILAAPGHVREGEMLLAWVIFVPFLPSFLFPDQKTTLSRCSFCLPRRSVVKAGTKRRRIRPLGRSPYPHFRAKIISRHPLAKRAQAVLSEPKRAQADDFTFWSSNPPPIEGNTPDLPEKNHTPLGFGKSTTCINSSAFMRAKPPEPYTFTAPCLQVAVALESVARRISVVAQDCILLYRRLVVGKATVGRGTRLTRQAFPSKSKIANLSRARRGDLKSKILFILPHPPTPGWTYAVHVIFSFAACNGQKSPVRRGLKRRGRNISAELPATAEGAPVVG